MDILVIDDEELIREIWEDCLSYKNYKIMLTANANEAISLLKNHDFKLVITDIRMPEANGYVLLDYLKENNLNIKTFVCTGCLDETQKIENDYSVLEIISKPFQIEPTLKLIKDAL